jgi:hypothetical protein
VKKPGDGLKRAVQIVLLICAGSIAFDLLLAWCLFRLYGWPWALAALALKWSIKIWLVRQ